VTTSENYVCLPHMLFSDVVTSSGILVQKIFLILVFVIHLV